MDVLQIPEYLRFWLGLIILVYLVLSLLLRSRRPWIPVWCVMAFSSFMTIVFGLVGFDEVGVVIDMDVILFLIGMFSLVGLAESSGLLNVIAAVFISMFKRTVALVCGASILFGLLAAFTVNDTIALIGPPIAYSISRVTRMNPKMMFLLLAFSLTIGSVMTPIGNPQNILIAVESGIEAPFLKFITKLTIPTLTNLVLTTYILLKKYKVKNDNLSMSLIPHEALKNRRDAILAGVGISLTVIALIINDLLQMYGEPHITYRGVIPFVVAAGTYLLTSNPRKTLAGVDWGTIIFFITMFITMEGVWRSGILKPILNIVMPSKTNGLVGILRITVISILLSQLLSNVPFVKLFINYMKDLGYTNLDYEAWIALAMSSTIAGNLTLLGAASNIIVLETLESKMKTTITFMEFLKVGTITTLANCIVYLIFLII